MYAVSPEDRYQIILSAYPNAKEDLRKCLSNNITDVINELSNIFNN